MPDPAAENPEWLKTASDAVARNPVLVADSRRLTRAGVRPRSGTSPRRRLRCRAAPSSAAQTSVSTPRPPSSRLESRAIKYANGSPPASEPLVTTRRSRRHVYAMSDRPSGGKADPRRAPPARALSGRRRCAPAARPEPRADHPPRRRRGPTTRPTVRPWAPVVGAPGTDVGGGGGSRGSGGRRPRRSGAPWRAGRPSATSTARTGCSVGTDSAVQKNGSAAAFRAATARLVGVDSGLAGVASVDRRGLLRCRAVRAPGAPHVSPPFCLPRPGDAVLGGMRGQGRRRRRRRDVGEPAAGDQRGDPQPRPREDRRGADGPGGRRRPGWR